MKFLEIQHISKSFGQDHIVKDLMISLDAHKTLSILGKSGCGKTTMLKIIAGILKADKGEIFLKEQNITSLQPNKRSVVYLYQDDILFPHLNVFENIAFGLRIKKMPENQIQDLVNSMIKSLELDGHEKKMPHQISGGQRQRVSFGRAIIINPSLLLLDEPFGSLDAGTRKTMQHLFQRLASEFEITSVFVTHDLKEAILMGDEIGFMESGHLKIYKSKEEFIRDATTGVGEEINFWSGLTSKLTE